MSENKVYRAIGLMSGTSLDGVIDVALIETDGHGYVKPLGYYEHPYDIAVRDEVRQSFGKTSYDNTVENAEELVTDLHIDAVKAGIKAFGQTPDVIGFHGQTITHDPDLAFTWQIGDGQKLAVSAGVPVVYDMRQQDIKSGGQGAPLLPLYHQAILSGRDHPVAVLNLGGVANMTYIGADGGLVAFDCGPGNALMDDFVKSRTGADFDENGRLASRGVVQENLIKDFIAHPYFKQKPPKSLDRNAWTLENVQYLSDEDGMATLMEMTMEGVERALTFMPEMPAQIYASGGGVKNLFLMDSLRSRLNAPLGTINDVGFNGDATEAEGFAYLAVRSLLGLHLTVPETTGVREPMVGGVLARVA